MILSDCVLVSTYCERKLSSSCDLLKEVLNEQIILIIKPSLGGPRY